MLNVDIKAPVTLDERRRAVHRIVRAMNDGACPACGYMDDRETMVIADGLRCPKCWFMITKQDIERAMGQFREVMKSSLAVFSEWRSRGHKHPNEPDAVWRNQCPDCGSPDPKLHPAVQFEGEVQSCPHPFHAAGC